MTTRKPEDKRVYKHGYTTSAGVLIALVLLILIAKFG